MLCFVDADWPSIGGALKHKALIPSARRAERLLRRSGAHDEVMVELMYSRLIDAFPPA